MRAALHSWATLTRHLRPGEVLRDLAVLTIVGSLAGFSALFTGRVWFDNVVHQAGLDYAVTAPAAAPDGGAITISSRTALDVTSSDADPSEPEAWRSVTPTMWVYPEAQGDHAQRLTRGIVIAGGLSPDGVALDEATASVLGVGVGDEVRLQWITITDEPEQRVRITALTTPFHPAKSYGHGGLMILSDAQLKRLYPALSASPPEATNSYWAESATATSGQTKWAVVAEAAVGTPQVSWFVGLVCLVSAGIWVLGVWRVLRLLLDRLGWIAVTMTDLGQSPAVTRWYFATFITTVAGFSATGAALVARWFILSWTSLFVTARQIVLVTASLTLIALIFTLVAARRVADIASLTTSPEWSRS